MNADDAAPSLGVERVDTLVLVQDAGRACGPDAGVAVSGAFDSRAHALANRLVGNGQGAATLEVLLGGLVLRATSSVVIAVTGAPVDLRIDGRSAPLEAGCAVRAGARIELLAPTTGLRAYLSVRGGVDAPMVLGSRSRDTLGGIGPAPLGVGDVLRVGDDVGGDAHFEPSPRRSIDAAAPIDVHVGPHADLLRDADVGALFGAPWIVDARADRVGVRLAPLARRTLPRLPGDLPSFPVFPGCVQLPPDGQPVVLGPDAGTTGGYAVIGVLSRGGLDRLAQTRPGERVRLRMARR